MNPTSPTASAFGRRVSLRTVARITVAATLAIVVTALIRDRTVRESRAVAARAAVAAGRYPEARDALCRWLSLDPGAGEGIS